MSRDIEGTGIEAGGGVQTHSCPWPECSKRVPPDRFACPAHWMQLPAPHKNAILSGWRSGDRQAHALAMGEALRWMNGPRTKLENVHLQIRGERARTRPAAAGSSVCSGPRCGAAIRWAETRTGKPIPLDAEPHPDGPVVLEPRPGGKPSLAIVVGKPKPAPAQLDLLAPPLEVDDRPRWMPHHATCPDAPRFR